jgi:anaerobic magnesium-protoporphyrin IX monomethyl ester cyclase
MVRKKVVLYNPVAAFYTMPLALIAVGSALDAGRYEVKIIDGRLEQDPVKRVIAESKDALCFGLSVLTGAPISDALTISRTIKAKYPEKPVVWGGWHPSLLPAETMAEPSVDIAVVGQGEATFAELVETIATGSSPARLAGTISRRGQEVIFNAPRPLKDMNDFPAHDYGLVAAEDYFRLKNKRQLDYIGSTGCRFRCAFCADPFVFHREWVGLRPQRLGDDIEFLWHRYRFTDLNFQDETFFTHRARVVAIAEEFLRRELHFTWTGTLRADQGCRLSDDEFALCVRSGLRRVMIGGESGSQATLDWMKKDILLSQVVQVAEQCVRHKIGAIFSFMVGFPDEPDESVMATLDLVKRLRAMSPGFETPIFYFKPYPGSQMTGDLGRDGHPLPKSNQEWADFDYIGSPGPWITPEKFKLIERFKFYNRFAWGPETRLRWPLQKVARWRCRRNLYGAPFEKLIVERLKSPTKLS